MCVENAKVRVSEDEVDFNLSLCSSLTFISIKRPCFTVTFSSFQVFRKVLCITNHFYMNTFPSVSMIDPNLILVSSCMRPTCSFLWRDDDKVICLFKLTLNPPYC